MTSDANRLTAHATATASLSTVPASAAAPWFQALRLLGHDVPALLSTVGLDESRFEDPDYRAPCDAVFGVLALAQRRKWIPNFGVRVAETTPFGAYPLLDYLIGTTNTVGEGLRHLSRYLRLNAPMRIDISEEADGFRVQVDGPDDPFGVEYTVSLPLFHLKREVVGAPCAELVSFKHQPDDTAAIE